jgi:LAGLIDADG-like domain
MPKGTRGRYRRHVPYDKDRRLRGYRTLPLQWSEPMAYVVGLLATDGCMSKDRRHVVLTSRDLQLVETYLTCLGRPLRYTVGRTRKGERIYYAQFADVAFYDWLLSIGLHPRKTLTLGAIDVPDEYLACLTRGLLDGDGTISVFTHAPTRSIYPNYTYERLWVFFLSASRSHIEWLQGRLERQFHVKGYVETIVRRNKHDMFRLKFGKKESTQLLVKLYEDPTAPRLNRKWMKWRDYALRNTCAEGGI